MDEQLANYEKANLMHKRSALINRKFLLVHGTADGEPEIALNL